MERAEPRVIPRSHICEDDCDVPCDRKEGGAVRCGQAELSEGHQQGARRRAEVRKDVAVLERQDRFGRRRKQLGGWEVGSWKEMN